MPLLGSFCLLFALALAAYCFVVGVIAAVRHDAVGYRLAETARRAGMASFAAVLVAAGALVYAALTDDFSVAYILHHSNRALPGPYKFAVLWSGQEGSVLFWALLLSAYGFVLRLRHKVDQRLVAMASMVLAGIQVFFLILANFAANPFGMMESVAADGSGLNPLLQYPEMVIHPPMLYLGYVGVSVPFAFALAALIMRYPGEKWIHITRRWTMVAWLFLTFGISLGAHWAYAVLGWGGYWGWDPVENASLLPWLSTTAFLHSVMMQEKRGMMKVWNVWLIFITFMLSILGTMLTRSGMVSSVHAFAQSSIGTWFAGFLGVTGVVCLVFFVLNRDHLRSENKLESLVSRESSFLFNNLVLLGACFAVLCGTLFPMLSEAVRGVKMNLGAPFYNKVMVPIGLFLIFLTGVGPLLAWRNTSVGSIKRNFAIPATIALCIELVVSGILLKNGVRFWTDTGQMYAMLSFCLSTLVVATIASEFIRGGIVWKNKLQTNLLFGMYQLSRRNMRRYGGYVVHFGVVLVVIGLAGAAFNRDVEQTIGKGDKVSIGRYTLIGEEYTDDDNANYISQAALLDVYRDGKFLTRLNPEERFFKASGGQPVHIVANHSTLMEDLYVVYEGRDGDSGHPIIKAMVNPLVNWIWIGVLVIVLGTGMALVPNATPMSVPVPSPVAVASMEKQGMQPAGVGK
ncbi:MAG TPA: heme lyase CcmF/NrfE family subunit [Candidatus Angelobacter sp.]|jgi:cytochrome c-type biogenesis protein CcmF|nr:heme lyase CcmF/NrfE family subunit [Candidatus Angelobacter sp.]